MRARRIFFAALLVAAGTGAASAQSVQKVDIATMTDTPQLVEVHDGIISGLKKLGFVDGQNIKTEFKSAQGNFGTAQQIVRQYVGDRPAVIVPITTPVSQAAAAATKDVPVVFTTVTDPVKAKIVASMSKPRGNVTGVIDFVPTAQQLKVVKEIVPGLKKLGLVYDPSLSNAVSTVESVKQVAPELGITTVESPAMGLNNVVAAGQALVGKVDAIFVPNDTTVYAVFESLVKVCQEGKVPLFTAERRSVQRGAIATVGYDFKQMGEITASVVARVLKGEKPGDIDVVQMDQVPNALSLYVNKASAEKMGVTIPPEMLKRAAQVF
jgi:putative tryptophan/tyrosine transport system substrate-binding protein